MLKLIFNADDFGMSEGITDRIIEACDAGSLNSVSLVPNGYAFDYAVKKLLERPHLRVSIHLNLYEGPSVAPSAELPDLTNSAGDLNGTFVSLWMKYLLAGVDRRQRLRQQVRKELALQIRKVRKALGGERELNLDSHQHLHMVPFVFEELVHLKSEFPIQYIRTAMEPLFFPKDKSLYWPAIKELNILKHYLLRVLSKAHKNLLRSAHIPTCDQFIGVLYTNQMTETVIRTGLSRLQKKSSGMVEILSHPGQAYDREQHLWYERPLLIQYYCSSNRELERNALLSSSLAQFLNQYSNSSDPTKPEIV